MDKLISAGLELGSNLIGIAAQAIAGAFKTSDELRAAFLAAVDRFSAFIAVGGEMDARRDAARAKTDAAIEKAEHAAPNPTALVDPDKLP